MENTHSSVLLGLTETGLAVVALNPHPDTTADHELHLVPLSVSRQHQASSGCFCIPRVELTQGEVPVWKYFHTDVSQVEPKTAATRLKRFLWPRNK